MNIMLIPDSRIMILWLSCSWRQTGEVFKLIDLIQNPMAAEWMVESSPQLQDTHNLSKTSSWQSPYSSAVKLYIEQIWEC